MNLHHFTKAGLLWLMWLLATPLQAQTQAQTPASPPASPPAPTSAWLEVASVLKHPRCMNCHPVGNFPRQGDDRHRHQQLVMRGAHDEGVATLQCSSCHQEANSFDGKVPGAPHWKLAPLSMAWEHLNDQQLCLALKDQAKNGGRDLLALSKHMTEDALVQWAWLPGARAAPPLSQSAFHAAVRRWVQAGGPCD